MDNNHELEIKRNLLHLFLGLVIVIYVCLSKPVFDRLIVIPLIIAVIIMLILPSVKINVVQKTISKYILQEFEREENIKRFPFKGAVWLAIGVTFPILFIPSDNFNVVCAIIMIAAVGDSFSTIVGKVYGKHKIGGRTVEGAITFIISGFLGALIFVDPLLALILAFVGSVIELLAFFDDNLLIPLFLTIFYLSFI